MAQRVVYTDRAFADIDRIIEFNNFRNRSKSYSRKFLSNLRARLIKLAKQPLSGLQTEKIDTFILIWDNFYIFYKPQESFIEIVAIYHQKENINR
jgi:plasmid stabilization system protein ParE